MASKDVLTVVVSIEVGLLCLAMERAKRVFAIFCFRFSGVARRGKQMLVDTGSSHKNMNDVNRNSSIVMVMRRYD